MIIETVKVNCVLITDDCDVNVEIMKRHIEPNVFNNSLIEYYTIVKGC
jgi:hypothetical protein